MILQSESDPECPDEYRDVSRGWIFYQFKYLSLKLPFRRPSLILIVGAGVSPSIQFAPCLVPRNVTNHSGSASLLRLFNVRKRFPSDFFTLRDEEEKNSIEGLPLVETFTSEKSI